MAYRPKRSVLTLHKKARRPRRWPPAPLTMREKLAAAVAIVKS